MDTSTKWALSILVVLLLVVSTVALVSRSATQEAVTVAKAEGLKEGKASVDVTSDNQEAIDKALVEEREKQVDKEPVAEKIVDTATQVETPIVVTKLVFGKVTKDGLKLGESVEQITKLLFKDTVSFDSDEFTVKSYLITSVDGLKVSTSLDGDKDFESEPRLTYTRKAIELRAEFKDGFVMSDIGTSGHDKSVKFNLFNIPVELIKADNDEVTIVYGDVGFVRDGQEFKGVKLETVGNNRAVLSCIEGTTVETISVSEGATSKLCGTEVRVTDFLVRNNAGESSVFLSVGTDVIEVISDGKSFIKDDEGNDVWVWSIDTDSNYIGFRLAERAETSDDKVLKVGDSLDLAHFATLLFAKDNEPTVNKYDVSFDNYVIDSVETDVAVFSGKFTYGSDDETTKLLWNGSSFFAKDDDNKWVSVSDVKFGDSDVALGTDLTFEGVTLELVDGQIDATISGESILNEDHSILTGYGMVFNSVDDLEDVDEISFSMPEERAEFKIEVA